MVEIWVDNGYGIWDRELIGVDIKKQVNYIKTLLPTKYANMLSSINADETSSDFLDGCKEWINNYYDDEGSGHGFCTLFANGISNHEGDLLIEHISDGDDGAIIYTDRQPWEIPSSLKNMSRQDLDNVFFKYLNIVGLDKTQVEIGRRGVERQYC